MVLPEDVKQVTILMPSLTFSLCVPGQKKKEFFHVLNMAELGKMEVFKSFGFSKSRTEHNIHSSIFGIQPVKMKFQQVPVK